MDSGTSRPVPFVPIKHPDLGAVAELLEQTRAENRYTNFGPVWRLLSGEIAAYLGHGPSRKVSACASATAGLSAAGGALTISAGRPLRWAGSAFAFFSTSINIFAPAAIVDCRSDGTLDLEAVAALPRGSVDGIIWTNPFGLCQDLSEVFAFCGERDLKLIVDNAAGLGTLTAATLPPEADTIEWVEVVSFHHTKPFGIGEGGAANLSAELGPVFEAVINFGVGLPDAFRVFYFNGKISELASAAILARLRTAGEWRGAYLAQARRIAALGRAAGLMPWIDTPWPRTTPGHLPFQSPWPVRRDQLGNASVVLNKYYPPPRTSRFPVAARLFDHIINVPCHPGLAELGDDEIVRCLAEVLARARSN